MSTVLALAAVACFATAAAVVVRTDPRDYGSRRFDVTVMGLLLGGVALAVASRWVPVL